MDAMGGGQGDQHNTIRNGLHNDQANGQHDQEKGQDPALPAAA